MGATKWTDDQRTEALRLLADVGKAEAARRTGIPAGTIGSWGTRAGVRSAGVEVTAAATAAKVATVNQRRSVLAEGLLDDIVKLRAELFTPCVERKPVVVSGGKGEPSAVEIAEVTHDRPGFVEQKALMVAIAVAIDKVQLLLGDVTARFGFPAAPAEPAEELAEPAARERALALVRDLGTRAS